MADSFGKISCTAAVTISLIPLICRPDLHILEPRWSGAVSGAHGLHRLAFAAVGRAPQRPLVARADRFHGVPEFSGDPGIRRILEHPSQLAALDLPADFAAELEVIALIVNRPGAVGLHVDAVVNAGDELVEGQRFFAGQDADVSHADQGNAVPAFGANGSIRSLLADGAGGFPRRDVSGEQAVSDDGRTLRLHSFIVVSECAQPGTMLLCRVGNYIHDVASVTKRAELVQCQK